MKQRLINANKLRKDFLDLPNCYNGFSDTYDKSLIIDVVDEQPTVEVVWCKDCKWWKLSEDNTFGMHICKKFSGVRKEYDFCSRGEEKFEIAYTAIPVEWMKTWLEKNREPYDPFGILSWGIKTMIKDWEKENVEQRRI